MTTMHRKNKAKRRGSKCMYEPWFWPSVRRRRRRNELAKLSRRKNRRK